MKDPCFALLTLPAMATIVKATTVKTLPHVARCFNSIWLISSLVKLLIIMILNKQDSSLTQHRLKKLGPLGPVVAGIFQN